MLSLLSSDPLKRFLERERALLEAVGRLAGSAIQNARLFAALQTELEERLRAENALKQRDAILEAVTYASERFLAVPDWRLSIQEVLDRLGREAVVSHAYLIEFVFPAEKEPLYSIPYVWSAPNTQVQLRPFSHVHLPLSQAGWNGIVDSLKRGEIYIDNGNSIHLTAFQSDGTDFPSSLQTRSIVSVPVFLNDALWGALSFDDCLTEREWTEVEVDALRVAAGILSAAIQRQQADQALRQLNAELEQRVRQRTADLETAYQELEAFTYSVSHDLRTPLRGIDGYSKLMLEDYGSRLDEDGRLYLENIRRATLQMGHLIEDLLKLSRVTRTEMRQEIVDLSGMASALAEEFQRYEPSRQVDFQIMPGMKVNGDSNLMRLALENLISNAWKFTSKGNHARIEIGQLSEAPEQVFYVRDNGVGFDMKYYDKLFRPFQRLHNATEFEGTGVGLATVQRIIQRHSGRIWAEAAVGQGACFYFSLPTP